MLIDKTTGFISVSVEIFASTSDWGAANCGVLVTYRSNRIKRMSNRRQKIAARRECRVISIDEIKKHA